MESRAVIEQLERLLPSVMQADAAWCARRLDGARQRLRRRQPIDRIVDQVARRLQDSATRLGERRQRVPAPACDDTLPIHARREDIVEAIRKHQVLILAGETGSGKTTQLPKFCLEAGRGIRGLIGCTQPRRIAARAMADRVSEELGTELGGPVGFQVRFRERVSPDSFVKFMTDGILLAETAHDPDLNAYDTLVIDEAHERSLNIDFLLGYLKQLLPRRPDLRVVITSATIDTDKFSRHFDHAPVIEVSGRGYPVEVIYQPVGEDEDTREPGNRNIYRGIGDAVARLSRIDPRGDILVFLSGEREIREAMHELGRRNLRNTEVLPLYARLSNAEQRRVFHPGAARRIILSTNVAETSLTVPRIRFVIDTGFARISRYAHRSRIQRLPIEPVSQASADQRKGRCGRLGPGTCVRLYSEEDFDLRPEYTEPEILRTSLASVILRMATMSLGAVEGFPFIDPPAPRMISDAYQLLFELRAVDGNRDPTPLGRQLAGWPLDVRLARMILEGSRESCLEDALVLAAALSIQDPRERPLDAQAAADTAHERFADQKSDFDALLKLWEYLRAARRDHTGNQFRKLCRREFLNWQRVLEWFDLYQQLRDQAREERLALRGGHGDYLNLHKALLSGLVSQVGQRDPEDPSYLGARGRRFHIFPGSGLFGRAPRWLMSAEIVETTKPYARINAEIEPAWIEQVASHLVKRQYLEPTWSRKRGEVMAWEQVSLFGLVLVERRRLRYEPVDPVESRRIFIREALVRDEIDGSFPFLEANRALWAEVEAVEHKRRSRDAMVDEEALCRFFDERLAEDVCSSKGLARWLKATGKGGDRGLRYARGDLLREGAPEADPASWPDSLRFSGQDMALRYLFQPGDAADGITVVVPLAGLNLVDAGQAQWLVPGLLEEKVLALLKTLPKPLRRVVTPVPRFAEIANESLGGDRGRALLEALSAALRQTTGVAIEVADFDESALPDHLRMRFEVLDEEGKILAAGRDLAALQDRFGDRARRDFMDRQGKGWNLDGITAWDFGDLPASIETPGCARAWPALVDQENAAGLRLFDREDEALAAHGAGVTRLLALALDDKLKYLQKRHGLAREACLAWAPRGDLKDLVTDMCQASLAEVAGEEVYRLRTEGEFNALASRCRSRIVGVFQGLAETLERTLLLGSTVHSALDGLERSRPEAGADLRSQAEDLLYPGFLLDLEPGRLKHYPRYLEAMRFRIERIELNPARDASQLRVLAPWWDRYQEHLASGAEYDEALDAYRWLLHEYRVSLFAQHLGTDGKVSAKRLSAAWEAVISGG